MTNKNIKNKRGRPKGAPTVKRSIALQEQLNAYLVRKHNETMISYNSLINLAISKMKENEGSKRDE